MSGSNFHKLRFKNGQCIRVFDSGVEEIYDCTPKWAIAEPENLINKTIVENSNKKLAVLINGYNENTD